MKNYYNTFQHNFKITDIKKEIYKCIIQLHSHEKKKKIITLKFITPTLNVTYAAESNFFLFISKLHNEIVQAIDYFISLS